MALLFERVSTERCAAHAIYEINKDGAKGPKGDKFHEKEETDLRKKVRGDGRKVC